MFITVDDTKIFATSFGAKTAPAMLLLGGWIGSWEDWLEPMSILSEDWHVIAYDHRGSGITVSSAETISLATLVDDVFTVMEFYDIKHCVIGAMSMGAAVALSAALRHPERISGIILANSLDLRDLPSDNNDAFLLGLTHHYPQALTGFINACIVEPDSDHIKNWGHHILNRATQESAIALYKMSKTINLRDDLHNITQPTLLIHGDSDRISPLESAQWLEEAIPNATLKVIKGAGHVPILTRPDELAQEIQTFFSH